MFRWDIFLHFLYQDPNLFFLRAAWTTLWISVVAQTCGVIIGLFLALMRMSRFPLLVWPARAYIWFFRGSPPSGPGLLLFYRPPQGIQNPSFFLPYWATLVVTLLLN